MKNFDKERMNQSINEAYNNQSEKVKELLQTAKDNLAVNKPVYDYTGSKKEFKYMSNIARTVSKKKEIENTVENKLDTKFAEMQEKLNINSKNLDVIFENVAQNNQKEIDLIKEIKELSIDSNDNLEGFINRKLEQNRNEIISKINDIKSEELTNSKLQEVKNEIVQTIKSKEITIKPELEETKDIIYQKIQASQNVMENRISQTKNILEKKIDNIKMPEVTATISDEMIAQLRQEMSQMYQYESRYLIDSFREEKNSYMKLIEEKDKEIRYLNDRVYKCEERLQKEIEKRHRASIFSSFFRKEEEVEEQPVYTSQILSYLY